MCRMSGSRAWPAGRGPDGPRWARTRHTSYVISGGGRREDSAGRDLPEVDPGVVHPLDLAVREHVHAGVLRVVHEVVDGVEARRAARVGTRRAVELGHRLARGVSHEVTARRAGALEGVLEHEPV